MTERGSEIRNHMVSWFNEIPESDLRWVLQIAMRGAARGLSQMVGHSIEITPLRVQTVAISQIATYAGDPEAEAVGVYLMIEGTLPGRAILLLSSASALRLVDMLTNVLSGTTTHLGDLERSALAEVGNLMVSYFLNTVAKFLARPELLHPSPPAVMVDMLGAILDMSVAPAAALGDDLLVVETAFTQDASADPERTVQVRFWILPDVTIPGLA